MDGKLYLKSLVIMNRGITERNLELARLRSSLTGSSGGDGVKVASSKSYDRMERTIAEIIQLEKIIDDDIDLFRERKDFAERIILDIPNELYQDILFARYFECLGCRKVMERLHLDEDAKRKYFKWQNKALIEFNRRFKNLYVEKT